ncbi:hypothetical protein SAMN04487819_11678 [Actinopolyspora alba]|uniref:Uncharacterized protein n=1 Tax=Actinopolyspora alba TaxID=673379 RepID=A0A1I2BGB5_9ACTN|nr:hypothetical protein [Actinopolyspora alba]SFE54888.1 hypothetical protein SAMN04487819_11678 [Actinopolyspora alba]
MGYNVRIHANKTDQYPEAEQVQLDNGHLVLYKRGSLGPNNIDAIYAPGKWESVAKTSDQ